MKPKQIATLYTAVLSMVLFLIVIPGDAQVTRQKIIFNNDWKFYKGDIANGESVRFNDNKWRNITMPHDWSIEGPFSEEWASATAYLPGGIGWYRKTFTLQQNMQNKNVFIYFDGVYKNSEVWINGHLLGKRPNGFIAFEYELTPYLNRGGKNIIAVKVDHTEFADSRWYTGSGINRNVYLIATDPVHVSKWGVSFTTPQVSQSQATASVEVSIDNQSVDAKEVTVKAQLSDDKGKVVSSAENKLSVEKNAAGKTQMPMEVTGPKLWSIENPLFTN